MSEWSIVAGSDTQHRGGGVDVRPRFGSVHHVSFAVSDVDRSVDFYVGVLGCRQLPRPEMGFRGAWLQIGEQQIHLMECPATDDAGAGPGSQVPDPRNNHVAFVVDDLDAAKQYLSGHGVTIATSPIALSQAFFCDPDGNTLEMIVPPGTGSP